MNSLFDIPRGSLVVATAAAVVVSRGAQFHKSQKLYKDYNDFASRRCNMPVFFFFFYFFYPPKIWLFSTSETRAKICTSRRRCERADALSETDGFR